MERRPRRVTIAEVDLRPGGTWRYVMTANGGFEVAFHGEYREIVPGERIVSIEVFEGMPDAEAVVTVTFTEKDGRTTLTMLVQHTVAIAARDLIACYARGAVPVAIGSA